jgi:FlaA1/EpsC-like NDP-sugar epimerase
MRDRQLRNRELVSHFHRVLVIGIQAALVIASNSMAFALRFDGDAPPWAETAFLQMLPWLVAIRAITFIPFGLYESLWRYTSLYDLKALVGAVLSSSLIFYATVQSPIGPRSYPRSIFIIDASLLLLMLGAVRVMRRLHGEFVLIRPGKRVLIFGAGDAAERIVRDMKTNRDSQYLPIGFVDDDVNKLGRRIHGVPVLGTRQDIPRIVRNHQPQEALIAIPSANPDAVRSIVRAFEPFKIPIKTLPNLRDIIVDGKVEVGQIRNLSLEDLLSRPPVGLDEEPVKRLIAGRSVLVTGAGGSIGAELCRQIARLKPSALLMFDRYENGLHAISTELEDQNLGFNLVSLVGDVADEIRINQVLQDHRPAIVFHAAAHKHVPLMERNPCEAVKNNVCGTRVMVAAAERAAVDRFIMISTDKAVNPTSVMGASKKIAEMIVQTKAAGGSTCFSTVRFGNVLGSNGSVVPRFMEQIRRGGPVTITHPQMRRYFMLIPEAVQLVLHAASHAKGGAIYVLEMGAQIRLLDMARDMIRLSGLVPEEDIKIEFTGVRPGEKLYEQLVGNDEEIGVGTAENILQVRRLRPPPVNFAAKLEALEAAANRGHSAAVLASMTELTGLSVNRMQTEIEDFEGDQITLRPASSRTPGTASFATSTEPLRSR